MRVSSSRRQSVLDNLNVCLQFSSTYSPRKGIENAKILVANTPMDTDKIKIFGATIEAESPDQVAAIEKAERERMLNKCEKILSHGINCFINRQLIYNLPEQVWKSNLSFLTPCQFFADHGVMAIEHADFEGVERLALVTGSEIVSTFDNPERVHLGHCDLYVKSLLYLTM